MRTWSDLRPLALVALLGCRDHAAVPRTRDDAARPTAVDAATLDASADAPSVAPRPVGPMVGPEGVSAEVTQFRNRDAKTPRHETLRRDQHSSGPALVFDLHNGGTRTIGSFECEIRYYDADGSLVPIQTPSGPLDHDKSTMTGLRARTVGRFCDEVLRPGETSHESLPPNYGPIPSAAVRAEITITRVCAIRCSRDGFEIDRAHCWPPF